VDRATAANYAALARLASEAPGIVQHQKELGASKLYRVARVPAAARRRLLRTPRLAEMSDAEFAALTAPLVPRRRKVSGNMKAHGLRMRVRAFSDRLRAFRPGPIDDPDMRAALREDLVEAARLARALWSRL
jgi:hypothetical protein